MKHAQDIVAVGATLEASPDFHRRLRLSQTLAIALLCAVVAFAACSAFGASWLTCAVVAIVTLNTAPLLLGVILSAR